MALAQKFLDGEESVADFRRELETYSERMIRDGRKLYAEELSRVNEIMEELAFERRLSYLDAPLNIGVDVLRRHFGQHWGLGMDANLETVLSYSWENRPFVGVKPSDPVLRAFAKLGCYDYDLFIQQKEL